MANINQKNGIQQILNKINKMLENIGSEQNVLSSEVDSFLESDIEDHVEKELVHSIFFQLQDINEQMENMTWLNKHYKILHDFAQICSKTLDEDILLNQAYEMVSQVMSTDAFYIALYTEGDPHIHFVFMVDNGEFFPPTLIKFGDNYTSKVIQSREIIHQTKANPSEKDIPKFGSEDEITSSCLFVPVIIDDHVKGVISAQSYFDFAYRKEHEELLQIIGSQVINSIETARLYEKIYIMSQTDELTGLKNHRAFHEDLSKLINGVNQGITLVMIDSDNLKKVNDHFGHDIGDLYLQVVANGIKNMSNDFIEGYRYAGDEFMIIIKSRNENEPLNFYEKLNEYYADHPIVISDNQINISVSSGVALYPEHGSTVDALKKSADNALYMAKERGKNQLFIAGSM